MESRIVILGAVALGPKVACRLRRLDPQAKITLIDRDNLISYGGCGIPYYIGGDINDVEELYSTSAHIRRDKTFFENTKGVDIRIRTEAVSIERKAKCVLLRNLDSGAEDSIHYDKLVLATGAQPVLPPFPGSDLEGVFTIANLHEAEKIKTLMSQGKVGTAAIIGAGAIGVEICEAMADLWGITTHLIEMEGRILPTLFGDTMSSILKTHLNDKGVHLHLQERVQAITRNQQTSQLTVETSAGKIDADIVIVAAGVRPNTSLACASGLALGRSGGILVNNRMQTSDPDIYAGGDCVEIPNLLSGETMPMALGSLANRQGRIIADNIAGGNAYFKGAISSFCIKVFDLGAAKAGLNSEQARKAGFSPVTAIISQADRAHFYPGFEFLYIALIGDAKSGRVLGIEAVGSNGDAVKARVDAVAALLPYGISASDISTLEVSYAPPYASAMDAINNAGNALDNILAGHTVPIPAPEFLEQLTQGKLQVLDVRGEKEAAPFVAKFGERWCNIPLDKIRTSIDTLPQAEELCILCDTGARSYEAQTILCSFGVTNTRNIQGGMALLKMLSPSFPE